MCQATSLPRTSPCLENPFYAISSRRAAEQCGTVDLWNRFQRVEAEPIQTDTTAAPSESATPPESSSGCRGRPATFCQTFETAQRCGPEGIRHCLEHVWFGRRPVHPVPPHLN